MAFDWDLAETRVARWANILALVPGAYCGYVLWEQRHPAGTQLSKYPGFTFSVVIFLSCIALGAILNFLRSKGSEKQDVKPIGRSQAPSRLVIQSADYRAYAEGGRTCDVTECLQKMIKGHSLVLQIENHNFAVNGKDYVSEDPFYGQVKRLRVTYYFDDGPPVVTERPEHARIVLPEDTFLTGTIYALQKQLERVKIEDEAEKAKAQMGLPVSASDPLVYPEFIDARGTTGSNKRENQAYFTLVNRGGSEARSIILEPIEIDGKLVQFTRHRLAAPLLPKREVTFYPDVVTLDDKSVSDREKDLFHIFCLDYLALGDSTICEATKQVVATYQDSARNLFEVTCELVFDPAAHAAVRTGNRGPSPAIFTRNHRFRKIAKSSTPLQYGG